MKSKDTFSSYHPVINFLYFILVLVFGMCFMHPVCLGITLISALWYSINLNGGKGVKFALTYMLPLFIIATIFNPMFNHEGATILSYLPSGNPLTLESIIYGLASASMLTAVVLWFSCYSEVMTSDKFIYLFGKVIPALSLVISMTLRFIPKFKDQMNVVIDSQRSLGRDMNEKGLIKKIRRAITVISIMITWSLENAVETAASMNSRGYGLPGRTAFSIYTFDKRDLKALVWLLISAAVVCIGWVKGEFYSSYYPLLKFEISNAFSFIYFVMYFALCLTPVFINTVEDVKWKHIKSEI
ncbi:MAG: energy-coupling factor transporter transmembrane component T [Bacillota bacterium]|nr:energy-coupling factor transporter transmembrane component T [Bacillota bacterium]